MYFSNVDICAILSDDRINNRAVKTLITKIAEEWVMINSRGFEENAAFQRIQLSSASFILETAAEREFMRYAGFYRAFLQTVGLEVR